MEHRQIPDEWYERNRERPMTPLHRLLIIVAAPFVGLAMAMLFALIAFFNEREHRKRKRRVPR